MTYKYNTFGARFAAAIVDGIIFWPLYLMNDYLTKVINGEKGLLILWTLVVLCSFQIYAVLMHGKYGQTLGKKAMSVKIVSYPEEERITYKHAIIRDLPYIILLIVQVIISIAVILSPELIFNKTIQTASEYLGYADLLWFLLEIITMFFNPKKRALHDIIAKTVVIRI